ncbi:MAG TPA: sn-glycerol-3-phosphate ABC transporter ATP-binding protein UgpC [Giesbergeria sp.]|nr:sn-glycerol-3-phosphate ABC transporter ATP-binding protein UgpC [Giesbergeria sp.]
MAKIQLNQVQKNYGSVQVVKGISLTVEDGEFVAFLGPSGCGKSTTLRMIAGLEEVGTGSIFIGNRDVTRMEPKDRNVGMVFQNYALYPHKTVKENLGFGLRMRGVPKDEIEKRVMEAATMLSLGELLNRKPKQLSGGQMQRVALGRTLVRDADAFLLDEPLSNLDAKLRAQMRIELSQLHRKLRKTMIYVTHDQVEAMTMADRVVIMHGGVVQQVGTPLEIFDKPANLFVASFVGSPEMNFIDVTATQSGLQMGPVAVPLDDWNPPEVGKVYRLGVRPEHFIVDPTGSIEFVVDVVEQLGTSTLLIGTINGSLAQLQTPRLEAGYGDRLRLRVETRNLHFFDKQTGQRVDLVARG